MNTDVIQRITHLLANLQEVPYSNFVTIKNYLTTTEYDTSYSPVFEAVQTFYDSRHHKFPDLGWLSRQFPDYFNTYVPIAFHSDDIYAIETILRDEAYKNKVLSSTWKGDLETASDVLTEYKQVSSELVKAPTKSKEVFVNFSKEKKLFGQGIKTGILPLDTDIDFLPYKGFTTIVAPTKSFKTTLACNIVYDAVINQSKNVVYLTLEDQYKSVWSNLLCKHSYQMGIPISTNEIKKYKLSDDRENLFNKMQDNFDASMTGNLVVLSSENLYSFTPDIIESQLRFYEKLWGCVDMVVVDHFSIMDDPIPGKHLSGTELYKYYVRFMTKLSISFSEKGLVLLGLGQVTREYTELLTKGEKMRSTGVANTSEMERSASLMLCTYASDEMKKSGNLNISVIVNRNGPSDITHTVPIKPEFASIGDQFVEEFDDETLDAICNGDLDIPLKKNLTVGISFTQFKNSLKGIK
jgi:hypothetical protein